MTSGHAGRRSLYDCRDEWHRVPKMYELRELRRLANLGQREFAALLSVLITSDKASYCRSPDWRVSFTSTCGRCKPPRVPGGSTHGAAGKAVIYQWESRKRTPSPVLWQRIRELER